MLDEPVLYLAGLVAVWPLVGTCVGLATAEDHRGVAVSLVWAGAAGLLAGVTLLAAASWGSPSTSWEGMRRLGFGLLGLASIAGGVLAGSIAAIIRWWTNSR